METEDIALIVSIVALGLSVLSVWQNKKLNSTNLYSHYFEQVFEEYLLIKIPDCAKRLCYNETGKLNSSYKELNKVLLSMLEDASYFAYARNGFYENLREKIIRFDEMVVEMAADKCNNKDEQVKNVYSLHQELQKIIKTINKNYIS